MSKIVDFAHLHCHSEFSMLDGMPKVEEYVIKSAEIGFPALALTEHGNLRSMLQLYMKCKKEFDYAGEKIDVNLKPIVGCEFYLTPNDYRIKGLSDDIKNKIRRNASTPKEVRDLTRDEENKVGTRVRFHILAFAKNKVGLKNLLILNYLSWKNGFYYRPRIDIRLLFKYSEGLVVTSSCIGGILPKLLLNDMEKESVDHIKAMKRIFKDDFYIEIQPHNIKEQISVNPRLVYVAQQYGVKIIATNDCHYLNKNDDKAHNMLLDIQSKATAMSKDRWRFGDNGFYLRTKDEMLTAFAKNHKTIPKKVIKNALENTMEIVEKCNVKFKLDKKQGILPAVSVPKKYDSDTKYIIDLCKKGWKWRDIDTKIKEYADFHGIGIGETKKIYKDRLKLELKRIFKLKFTKYFLIIHDLIYWARKNGIYVGPGRGSSSGSIVCYLLGITSIDPLRYGLLFDRFLSEFRMDYPDVDMDFEDDRRKEIFTYLFKKYGYKNACMIGTTGRMKGKQALLDVGRVLGVPMNETLEVNKHIIIRPAGDARDSQTVEDSFKEFEVNKKYNKKYPKVLKFVTKLEGKARQVGIHAAGIQLAPFKMHRFIPIEYRMDNRVDVHVPVSGLDWRECQELGLIKLDVLGLKTLTSLRYSVEAVKQRHNVDIDLEKINLEDERVLKSFTDGNFAGIFQFDSIGMLTLCKRLVFDSFEDVIAMNALYRPGSMRSGEAKKYIDRKTGKVKIDKKHPIYDDITKGSYGIVIYQEQLMQVFMRVAGYQPSKADIVRKKVAKSTGVKSIWKEREDFMKGAKRNNVKKATAEWLFKNMSFFGSYAFNKAHAAAYSMISYSGMYLKVFYPTEFFYGLLRKEKKDEDILHFIKEAKKMGIEVNMPDVNLSDVQFSIVDDNIISVGLQDIKGCGDIASKIIVENKPYKSLRDFGQKVERRKVNKGVIESLVKVGAFDSMYSNTGALLKTITRMKSNGNKERLALWKFMIDSKSEKVCQKMYDKFNKKKYKLNEEEKQRLVASVSPIPPDKHEIEYYNYLDDNFRFISKVNTIDYKKDRYILKGVIVDIRYNNVGDFHKEEPDEKEKKRINWGARYASINIEDETGVHRMKIDIDIFSTFRHTIDKGLGTPVIVSCRTFRQNAMLMCDFICDLDNMRKIIDSGKIKKLNPYQKYFVKHPAVKFNKKKRNRLNKIKDRVGTFRNIVVLVLRVKIHWAKNNKKMAFIELEDETGLQNVVIWNNVLMEFKKHLVQGNIIKVDLTKTKKGCFIAEDANVKLIHQNYKLV